MVANYLLSMTFIILCLQIDYTGKRYISGLSAKVKTSNCAGISYLCSFNITFSATYAF